VQRSRIGRHRMADPRPAERGLQIGKQTPVVVLEGVVAEGRHRALQLLAAEISPIDPQHPPAILAVRSALGERLAEQLAGPSLASHAPRHRRDPAQRRFTRMLASLNPAPVEQCC